MSANGNVTVIPSGDLNYLCGKKMSIQLNTAPDRIACTFRGVAAERYLIIQMAVHPGREALPEPASVVVVRYINDGSVYGFKSRVIQSITRPFRLVFIKYPRELELYKLRSCERIDLFINALLAIHDLTFSGVVLDLSCSGCLMVLESDLVDSSLMVAGQQEGAITLSIDSERMTLPCRVVRIMEDESKLQLGIAFEFADERESEAIGNYVEQLAGFRS